MPCPPVACARLLMAASVLLLLAACGGRNLPLAPVRPHIEDGFSEPQRVPRAGIGDDQAQALRVQPGDRVTVEVVSTNTQVIPDVIVDATGQIHLPLVHDLAIAGLTATEAEQRILAVWRPLDKLVEIHLRLSGFEGQRATVLGAVHTQGPVQLVPGSRVADVMAQAGGPVLPGRGGDYVAADLDGAVVKRGGRPLPIDIRRALRGEPRHNVYVHPGDTIYVPPARGQNVSVLGQVGGSGVFPFREGLRLTELLAQAGGIGVGGDKNDVRIIRGSLAKPSVYRASLAALVRGETHDVLLRAGDIVFVSDHWVEDSAEVIGVISPLLSATLSAVTFNAVLER